MKDMIAIAVLFMSLSLCIPAYGASKSKVSDYLPLESEAAYSANVKTLKFHKPDCKHYNCRDCTKYFKSPQEARKAGYVECKVCWK